MSNWRIDESPFARPVGSITGTVTGFLKDGKNEKRVLFAKLRADEPDFHMWSPNKPNISKMRDYAELLTAFIKVVDAYYTGE